MRKIAYLHKRVRHLSLSLVLSRCLYVLNITGVGSESAVHQGQRERPATWMHLQREKCVLQLSGCKVTVASFLKGKHWRLKLSVHLIKQFTVFLWCVCAVKCRPARPDILRDYAKVEVAFRVVGNKLERRCSRSNAWLYILLIIFHSLLPCPYTSKKGERDTVCKSDQDTRWHCMLLQTTILLFTFHTVSCFCSVVSPASPVLYVLQCFLSVHLFLNFSFWILGFCVWTCFEKHRR